MSLFSNNALIGASAAGDYEIERSLRFNPADSSYLNRTPGTSNNYRQGTYSFWFKKVKNGAINSIIQSGRDGGGNDQAQIAVWSDDAIQVMSYSSSAYQLELKTTAKYRDPSSWYHFLFAWDTTQGVAANRAKLYINGEQVTDFATSTYPGDSDRMMFDNPNASASGVNRIGAYWGSSYNTDHSFSGLLADVNYVDGLMLDPTSFGETNADTGQWIPIEFKHSALNKENNNNNWSGNSTNLTNPTVAFDGDLASGTECYTSSGSAGDEGYFTLPTNITTSSLDVYIGTGVAGAEWWAEDTGGTKYTYSGGSNGWQTIPLGGTRTISKLGTKRNSSGSGSGHRAWRVDGEILISNYTTDANGYYLPFSDNSGTTSTTLGKDSAGSNNWTPNNFSVTAGTTNDSLTDTPTNNYCVLTNINCGPQIAIVEGGLKQTYSSAGNYHQSAVGSFGVNSGKWYWEIEKIGTFPDSEAYGITREDCRTTLNDGNMRTGVSSGVLGGNYYGYECRGYKGTANPSATGADSDGWITSPVYGATWLTAGDVIGIALDFSAGGTSGKITFYKNGASQGVAYSDIDCSYLWLPNISMYGDPLGNAQAWANFGQRPFKYTVPTGHKSLCTADLAEPTITKSDDNFNIVTYTGTGSDLAVTGVGFQADLVWIKNRSNSGNWHDVYDSIRGVTKRVMPNEDAAEQTQAQGLKAFSSDGWTVGNNSDVGSSGNTYVGWNWKAGGSPSSNGNGTIASSVSVNATAGISLASYTGDGAAGNSTVGHGLGVAPDFVIVKRRDTAGDWIIGHDGLATNAFTNTKFLKLNVSNDVFTNALVWGAQPTSTVVQITTGSTAGNLNASGGTYMMYSFASVAGFSRFGFFTGNGLANGPAIFTGFRPAWVMLKRVDAASEWNIWDIKRNPGEQPLAREIRANLDSDETSYQDPLRANDFLSNGFKMRTSDADHNAAGGRYAYMAFAKAPLKYANAR